MTQSVCTGSMLKTMSLFTLKKKKKHYTQITWSMAEIISVGKSINEKIIISPSTSFRGSLKEACASGLGLRIRNSALAAKATALPA